MSFNLVLTQLYELSLQIPVMVPSLKYSVDSRRKPTKPMKGAMTKKIEIFKRSLPVRLHKSSGRVVNSAGRKRKTLQLIIRESEVILKTCFSHSKKKKNYPS